MQPQKSLSEILREASPPDAQGPVMAGDFAGDTNRHIVGDLGGGGGFYPPYTGGFLNDATRNATLFISGGTTRSAPLFIRGGVIATRSSTLFEWGKAPVNRNAPLYIHGRTTANRAATLYTLSTVKVTRTAPLYIKAPVTRTAPLYVHGKTTANRSAPLCLLNKQSINRGAPLYVHGKITVNRSVPLFVDGGAFVNRSATLFTKGVFKANRSTTLFVKGLEARSSPLYVMGAFLKNRSAPLFMRAVLTRTGTLAVRGHISVNHSASLYTVAVYHGHIGIPLFTKTAPAVRMSRSAPLSIWASSNGTTGRRRSAPLYTVCIAGQGNIGAKKLNLYLSGPRTAPTKRNMNLVTAGFAHSTNRAAPLYVESSDGSPAGQACFVLETNQATEILLEDNIHCLVADSEAAASATLFIVGANIRAITRSLNLFLRHPISQTMPLYLKAPPMPTNRSIALRVAGLNPNSRSATLALPKTRGTQNRGITFIVRGW
jgi:hypothetical protein